MMWFILVLFTKSISCTEDGTEISWEQYKFENNLNFSDEEDIKRKDNFEKAIETIKEHNSKDKTFNMALNRFAHLDPEEVPRGFSYPKYP